MSLSHNNPILKNEQFREERHHFIGGSDVAGLYSLEPYHCELKLFLNKTGAEADVLFLGNRFTDRGSILEPIAAQKYAQVTGRDVRKAHPRQDDVIERLRPQPDYEILNDARGEKLGRGLLSIKCPGAEAFKKIKRAVMALREITEPKSDYERRLIEEGKQTLRPYTLQLQAEMGAQNVLWGSYYFFNADMWDGVYFDQDRDDEIIADIRARAGMMLVRIDTGDAPAKLDPESKQCRNCDYRISCQSEHLLEMLKGEGAATGEVVFIPQLDNLVMTLRENQQIEKEAKELVEDSKEQIEVLLGDADIAQGEHFKVYNRLQAGRETIQKAPLTKHVAALSKDAEKFLRKCDNNQIELDKDARFLLEQLEMLHGKLEGDFTKKGAPYRVLKNYDVPRSSGAVQ